MAKKSINPCPLELKDWVDYLVSLVKYRTSSTHTAQQSDFVKIVIILTGINIGFLLLNLITGYNFYPDLLNSIALIVSVFVVIYLIIKFKGIDS